MSPRPKKPLVPCALISKAMFLPPVTPRITPRPMNSIVSVAMKAGTSRTVTINPLISPMARPIARHQNTAVQTPMSK